MLSSPDSLYCLPPDGKYDSEGGMIIYIMPDKDKNSGLPPQDGCFRIECALREHKIICILEQSIRLKTVVGIKKNNKKGTKHMNTFPFYLARDSVC